MTTLQAAAQAQLRQFVEQIERLEEEKKALAADIRDKYLEAKGTGFDVKDAIRAKSGPKLGTKAVSRKIKLTPKVATGVLVVDDEHRTRRYA